MPKIHDKDILRPTRKILEFTALQPKSPISLDRNLSSAPHSTDILGHHFILYGVNTYHRESAFHIYLIRPSQSDAPYSRSHNSFRIAPCAFCCVRGGEGGGVFEKTIQIMVDVKWTRSTSHYTKRNGSAKSKWLFIVGLGS